MAQTCVFGYCLPEVFFECRHSYAATFRSVIEFLIKYKLSYEYMNEYVQRCNVCSGTWIARSLVYSRVRETRLDAHIRINKSWKIIQTHNGSYREILVFTCIEEILLACCRIRCHCISMDINAYR